MVIAVYATILGPVVFKTEMQNVFIFCKCGLGLLSQIKDKESLPIV